MRIANGTKATLLHLGTVFSMIWGKLLCFCPSIISKCTVLNCQTCRHNKEEKSGNMNFINFFLSFVIACKCSKVFFDTEYSMHDNLRSDSLIPLAKAASW